jgi:hypothetical protein
MLNDCDLRTLCRYEGQLLVLGEIPAARSVARALLPMGTGQETGIEDQGGLNDRVNKVGLHAGMDAALDPIARYACKRRSYGGQVESLRASKWSEGPH